MSPSLAASMTLLLASVGGVALWGTGPVAHAAEAPSVGAAAVPHAAPAAASTAPGGVAAEAARSAGAAEAPWSARLQRWFGGELVVELRRDDDAVSLQLSWRSVTAR
mgnify:CR=1 FL=1